MQLVDYILLAEFDIDSGSTLRHHYPNAVPGDHDADWFANCMLPEGIHNREQDSTHIFLNREGKRCTFQSIGDGCEEGTLFLYGLNVVRRRRDESVRRGATVKALCVFSRFHFIIDALKPAIQFALDRCFTASAQADVLERLYRDFNTSAANDLAQMLPRPSALEQALMRRSVGEAPQFLGQGAPEHQPTFADWHFSLPLTLEADAANHPSSLSIPLYRSPDEVGDASAVKLVRTFGGAGAMKIYNALLRRHRVLFVGYNHAAHDVASMVLSAIALVSPAIPGVLRRAFPYCSLTDLTFLSVAGYVGGATNPMFQSKEQWWDVLCVLDLPNLRGTVTVSSSSPSSPTDGESGNGSGSDDALALQEQHVHENADARFLAGLLSGLAAGCSEGWVRQRFHDLTTSLVNQALDQPSLLYSSRLADRTRKALETNAARTSLLRRTPEVQSLALLSPWQQQEPSLPPPSSLSSPSPSPSSYSRLPDGHELRMHIRRLSLEGGLSSAAEVEPMLEDLELVLGGGREADAQALLAMLPEADSGGLFPVAAALFCASPVARLSACRILLAVRSHHSTKPAVEALNSVLAAALARAEAKLADGSLEAEARVFALRRNNEA